MIKDFDSCMNDVLGMICLFCFIYIACIIIGIYLYCKNNNNDLRFIVLLIGIC